MTAVIVAKDLSKWYRQVIAVNRISFSLASGVVGLLGPNGAGKSTLMKMITGQLRPSQGEITLFDEQIWNHYGLFHRLGFCPEQDSFYERMTGKEFLAALLRLHGFSESDVIRKAESALDRVNLASAANKMIAAYSKGMRQRIKLAQAIAHDPEVLILDEPLSGMDPVARRETIRWIRELGREGKCILVSSHVLHEIEAMTHNILLLNHGQVLAQGDISQIRALIDEHPHNINIRCSDPRKMAAMLVGFSDVVSVRLRPEESALTIESSKPDEFYERLPELMLGQRIELEEISSPDDNLEAVFRYLVK
jgi:ABC-2 type transport system ATP-binding protein